MGGASSGGAYWVRMWNKRNIEKKTESQARTAGAEGLAALNSYGKSGGAVNAAEFSHQIRTPMNGLLGALELLSETALDSSQAEYVRLIHDSAMKLFRALGMDKTVQALTTETTDTGCEQKDSPLRLPNAIRILLVEDDDISRKIVADMLIRLGCSVQVARDGVEALAMLGIDSEHLDGSGDVSGYQHYDLVLMDNNMPKMDGMESCSILRGMERAWMASHRLATPSHLPVIALTAMDYEGNRERCLRAGMDDYLVKPVSRRELVQVIRYTLLRFVVDKPANNKPEEPDDFDQFPDVRFEQLQTVADNDAALIRELIGDFTSLIPGMLKELREALLRNDTENAARLSHKIAGSSSYIGAERMQRIGKEMERKIRAGNGAGCEELMKRMEYSYQQVAAFFAEKEISDSSR